MYLNTLGEGRWKGPMERADDSVDSITLHISGTVRYLKIVCSH
jgi:hypothetical protein